MVLWSLLIVAYAALAEYTIHRWVMHMPGFDRVWHEHAVLHHRDGRNDLNVDMSSTMALLLSAPLHALSPWLGVRFSVIVCCLAFVYAWAWTLLHRCIHGVGAAWVARLPGYRWWLAHHEAHHRRPGRNFGTVFTFTDRLFGTRA